MKLRDSKGWPVVTIIGRPIQNLIRCLLFTDIKQTFLGRNR